MRPALHVFLFFSALLLGVSPTVAADPAGLPEPVTSAVSGGDASSEGLAAPKEDPFRLGVEAYRRGRYGEAQSHWEQLLTRPLSVGVRARVAYDLGNALYRQEKPLQALGWYRVALHFAPRDRGARHNLELARAAAKLEPGDRGDLRSTLHRLATAWRPGEARTLLLGALCVFGLCLLGEALRGGRAWRRAAWVGFGLVVLAGVPRYALVRESLTGRMLVVRTPEVVLRSEPRMERDATGRLPGGGEVRRIDALPGWIRIETDDGTRGWVPEDALFALDPFGASE